MDEVSRREGRTVLFVSHNMAAMASLTSRGIVLESGSVVASGTTSEAISSYLSRGVNQSTYVCPPNHGATGPHIRQAEVVTTDPNGVQRFGMPLEIKFRLSHERPIARGCFSFQIINQFQQPVIHAFAYDLDLKARSALGETILTCWFPALQLNVGRFHLRTFLSEPPGGEVFESVDGICPFEVVRTDRQIPWGWRAEACAYHENWEWKELSVSSEAQS